MPCRVTVGIQHLHPARGGGGGGVAPHVHRHLLLSCRFHGRDRGGRPVYYERLDPQALTALLQAFDKEVLLRWHLYVIERGRERYRQLGTDRLVVVLDAAQVGLQLIRNHDAMKFLKVCPGCAVVSGWPLQRERCPRDRWHCPPEHARTRAHAPCTRTCTCTRIHPNIPNISEYFRIFPNVSEYFRIFPNISEYFRIFLNISEYFRMFPNISEYFRIFPNIFE